MATSPDVLTVLRSIDASLKELLHLARTRQQRTDQTAGTIAPDVDLDGAHGNPIIKAKDPKDWTQGTMIGKRFSECPPGYLDLLAKRYDYFAQKAETDGTLATNGQPKAQYDRRDAARARGWAKRLRDGWKPPETDPFMQSEWPSDSETF